MKRNLYTVIIGALLIIIFALLLFVFQVRRSEIAVVTTFGKPTGMAEPGPHLKWPWPIQKVYKFDQRIQNFEDKNTEGFTSDNYNLLAMAYIGWRITDPQNFYQRFRGGAISEAEKHMEEWLRSEKLAAISNHRLSDFVSADGTKLEAIEAEILAGVRAKLKDQNYGLDVEFLGLKKIGFPQSVTETVFGQMKAERGRLVSKLEGEGSAEAAKIKSDADRKAAEMINNAEAGAKRIRAVGEAAAAQSLLAFQQNPQLAGFLLRLDAFEAALKDRTTLIFDQRTPPFDLFNGVSTNLVK